MAKIVVVDDDPTFRGMLAAKLKSLGHSVAEAKDGKQGEKLVRADRPEVMLLDVWMPEQDGIETIVNIRKYAPEVKIIVMTGSPRGAGLRLFEMAESLGAFSTLQKPFPLATLLEKVNGAIGAQGSPLSETGS